MKNINNISIVATTYKGQENTVLQILNLNRPENQTLEYLDWRYLGEKSPIPPVIFWVLNEKGAPVGMSALIYRAYWCNGVKQYVGIRGDTSVNKSLRGQGIGKRLLGEILEHINKSEIKEAFSLANEGSHRASKAAGWMIGETFSPFVLLINPSKKIEEKIKSQMLSQLLGRLYFLKHMLKTLSKNDCRLQLIHVDSFDNDFNTFWNNYNKDEIFLRDRSIPTLEWRYLKHPHKTYEICKIHYDNVMVGFFIYHVVNENGINICHVVDFIVTQYSLIEVIALKFSRYLYKKFLRLYSVRLPLNDSNLYGPELKKAGFFKRAPDGVITKIFSNTEYWPKDVRWNITLGDKDI
jgi:GNAT superfamily N-acetyltransferase